MGTGFWPPQRQQNEKIELSFQPTGLTYGSIYQNLSFLRRMKNGEGNVNTEFCTLKKNNEETKRSKLIDGFFLVTPLVVVLKTKLISINLISG